MDSIKTYLVKDNIRVYIADTTETAKTACEIHSTSKVSGILLAKTVTATAILSKLLKNKNDVLTLKIKGSNQIKSVVGIGNVKGDIKAYISNTDADEYLGLNYKNIIGPGTITIVRDFKLKEPYVGVSPIVSGELDQDLSFYYRSSEQQKTKMKLECVYENGLISSKGIFVQLLPDYTEEEKEIYDHLDLADFKDVKDPMTHYFNDLSIKSMENYDIRFQCDCSYAKIYKALITLGKEEIKNIYEKDHKIELLCEFCKKKYSFNEEELKEMVDSFEDSN